MAAKSEKKQMSTGKSPVGWYNWFSAKGDTPYAWLVNISHLYLVNEKLDIGKQNSPSWTWLANNR